MENGGGYFQAETGRIGCTSPRLLQNAMIGQRVDRLPQDTSRQCVLAPGHRALVLFVVKSTHELATFSSEAMTVGVGLPRSTKIRAGGSKRFHLTTKCGRSYRRS